MKYCFLAIGFASVIMGFYFLKSHQKSLNLAGIYFSVIGLFIFLTGFFLFF